MKPRMQFSGRSAVVRSVLAFVLCVVATVQLYSQSVDWKEGGTVRWQATGSEKVWDSELDTFDVVFRVFDKASPIDTISLLVYYPESITAVQGRPAITIRLDGIKGAGSYIAKQTKAFYRTTDNRLATNESGDAVKLKISVFDTVNQAAAGAFDMECTYTDPVNNRKTKFRVRGGYRVRGFVIEPADVALNRGEEVKWKILATPRATVEISHGSSTQQVRADSSGIATYTYKLPASQPVEPVELSFRTSTTSTASVVRTVYVDTSFARPVVLRFPDKRGFQVQAFKDQATLNKRRRRAEFNRPEHFRATNFKVTDTACSVELWRLPIDSVRTVGTTATLAGVSVKTDVMIAAKSDTSLANRAAPDSALVQWLRARELKAVGAIRNDSVAIKINGGVYDGKTVRIPCRRQRFEKQEVLDTATGTVAALHTVRGELVAVNWGIAPAGVFDARRARGLLLLGVTTTIDQRTTDSTRIRLNNRAMLGLVHTGSTTAVIACDSLNAIFMKKAKDSLTGMVPEYLLLYDFSAAATVSPDSIDNINQYDRGEQADLPVRYSYKGGNACGASSLTMALSTLLPGEARGIREVYHNALQIGLNKSDATTATVVPPETEQAFLWERAARWLWGDTVSAGMCLTSSSASVYTCRLFSPDLSGGGLDARLRPAYGMRTWDEVDSWLAAKRPVLIGTFLGTGTAPSGGHVILLLGVGNNPDVRKMLASAGADTNYYIVADPAGHFYANPDGSGMNAGHYGLAGKLDSLALGMSHSGWFGIYPRDKFRLRAGTEDSTRRTLSFFNDSAVYVRLRSRCTFATNCAKRIEGGGKIPDVITGVEQQQDVPPAVAIALRDSEGRRTGMNADGSLVREIPGSEVNISAGEEEGGDGADGYEVQLRDALLIGLRAPEPGQYTVEVTGLESTEYDVDIVMYSVAKIDYSRRSERDTVEPNEKREYDILIPTDVGESKEQSNHLLRTTYPEPAASVANVEFAVERPQQVRLSIVNMMGSEIAVLLDGYVDAGAHLARWDTGAVPAGVYFCRLETNGAVEVRKITVIK